MLSEEELKTNRETQKHIDKVEMILCAFASAVLCRAPFHDESKLERPEVQVFAEYTPKLPDSTYGSEEYNRFVEEMKEALDHHYANNRHHPQHFEDGVNGMNLIDLVEMVCDWKAASLRHNDGDFRKSIEISAERFGLSDQLKQIILNTAEFLDRTV